MTRQKEQEDYKRGDRKGESNNSPEIPDRERTSDIIRLPLGDQSVKENPHTTLTQYTRILTPGTSPGTSSRLHNNSCLIAMAICLPCVHQTFRQLQSECVHVNL